MAGQRIGAGEVERIARVVGGGDEFEALAGAELQRPLAGDMGRV